MLILFWVYKSRINKSGEAPIMMRITSNEKRLSFSTNLFVSPKSWDQSKQKIKGISPLKVEMNKVLMNYTTIAWNTYNENIKNKIPVNPETIRSAIFRKEQSTSTLLEAISYQVGNLRARVGHDISANTVKKYLTLERKIKSFLSIRLSRNDINLNELDHRFIIELDLHMRTVGKLRHNAIVKNMQQLKRVIKISVLNGWIEKDPFMNYTCKPEETDRGYLTASEINILENVVLPNKRLEQTRDVFIFCCCTGLAYADVSKLQQSHLECDVNGIDWIKINRTKTKSRSVIPLLPRAKQILEKYIAYRDHSPNGNLLPVISNQNLNKYLKEIAVISGIDKRVSMHLARHTFATTITLEKGVDIVTVSRMLGHKKLSTTQIYSKVTELKIAEDMKKLL